MKSVLFWLATALLACVAMPAMAATKVLGGPAPGLWWNPNESGRGYTFDLQGNLLVMTTYAYNAQGATTWYVSAGTYSYATGTMIAKFDSSTNGQCLGCTYKAPTGLPNAGGAMKVIFDNAVSGTLYFNGGSTHIERQIFGFADLNAFLFGELQLSYNASGLVGGDWFLFNNNYTASDGTKYISGNLDGCTSCVTLGRYDPTLKAWTLIDKVGSYYTFYKLDMDDRRLVGVSWVYQNSPTGNGTVSLGSRVLARDELTAAMVTKPAQAALRAQPDAEFIANREESLRTIAAAQAKDATAFPAELIGARQVLQREIDRR